MKTATLYIAKGCPYCAEAQKEIEKRKKEGTLCYNYKCVDVVEKNINKVEAVPMVKIGGRLMSFSDSLKMCPVGK